jgi:hypothetical protein
MRKLPLIALLLLSLNVFAQNTSPNIGCKDAIILLQASTLKSDLLKQGFELLNDAMLSMESGDNFPVIVRMQAGTNYQVLFIGNKTCKEMSLELYSPSKKPLLQKKQEPLYQTPNVISFSFTPNESGDYTFMLSQEMKQKLFHAQKSTCGSFSILRLKKAAK